MSENKNCAGTYYVQGYTTSEGKRVEGYMRTCGAKHNSNENVKSPLSYEEKIQRRAELLFPKTEEKKMIIELKDNNKSSNQTIAGVPKGEPMTYEKAGGKNVNPDYNPMVNNFDRNQNCQSCVAVFEARMRGYDVEISYNKEAMQIKNYLQDNPNWAYIDIRTKKPPEFITLKVSSKEECIQELNNRIKKGERYIFGFAWIKNLQLDLNTGHVVTVMKNKDNKLIFYDPQCSKEYDTEYLHLVNFKFKWNEEGIKPKILRVDDKELDYKILNSISQPARK